VTYPPHVQSFGPIIQNGNLFSVEVAVYFPDPWDIVLYVLHDDGHTYNLGKLPVGAYEFVVYVRCVHNREGYVYLAGNVSFDVTSGMIKVPDNFPTIQEAIDYADEGDTILVKNGTYHENVVVNKRVSLVGDYLTTGFPVIDGSGDWSQPVSVIANNVTVEGFEIRDCRKEYGYAGVTLRNVSFCDICYNLLTDNFDGVYAENSSRNRIYSNTFVNNTWNGIHLKYQSSSNEILSNRIISNNNGISIEVDSESNCIVKNLIMVNEYDGIDVNSKQNVIVGNTIADCFTGLFIGAEADNLNVVYHNNFVNNTYQVTCHSTQNVWDNGCEGNFWSDYAGTDADQDGIGDTPYVINADNQDNYPLMKSFWCLTDINHDLKVDIRDVGRAARAFGTELGYPLWNPHADITGPEPSVPDQKVDIRDLSMIAKDFGKVYS
jgi:parallel beta-helix repeat protein